MVYELIIIIIASIFLYLVLRKYLERRHKLTLYLFIIFLNFVIALIFSWLSKLLRLYSGLDYLVDPSVPDPMTFESWFLLRIVSFRITMIFTIIALLYNHILKINLFETEENKIYNYLIHGYAGGSILYMIIVYIKGNNMLDLLTFVLILVYICLVMIPLMRSCFQAYKAVDDPSFKRGFISLFLMALSIILIFICQVIDRILMITLNIIGYTFFYFLGWSFAIVAIFFAYFGYINPKSKKE
jgi:hypothetical protein